MIELIHRKIDLQHDREYILESHCEINYECDTPWKRKMNYEEYRREWFSLSGQIAEFLGALEDSMKDPRTIAEIIENENSDTLGYLWAPFTRIRKAVSRSPIYRIFTLMRNTAKRVSRRSL